MARIKILPEHEARKIAAGEVVERPASVVKELLENALDAQATEITIALHDGGKKRIRITDNGCGMSPEDALLSIEHHATSKICSVDELTFISTFGFRGEALSSIASVSDMRITTRRHEDECGFELFIQQGSCHAGRSVAAPVGTSIVIEDLFLNVPARRKFLKQRDTEWRAIHQLVTAYALAFPYIGFTLHHEDALIYTAPGVATLLDRAQQLFPPDIATHFTAFEQTIGNIILSGVVTSHQVTRYDRKSIFSFVNQRWVKNHVLGKAIIAGYEGMLPHNKYPVAALLITLPKEQVDVNVHPRKEEVLLMHPQIVSTAIAQAVQKALSKRVSNLLSSVPSSDTTKHPTAFSYTTGSQSLSPVQQRAAQFLPDPFENNVSNWYELKNTKGRLPAVAVEAKVEASREGWERAEEIVDHSTAPEINVSQTSTISQDALVVLSQIPDVQPEQFTSVATVSYEIIGQLYATYLLLETPEGLMMLDQHAAHEAVLYNQLQEQSGALLAATLLFPECITYERESHSYMSDVISYLQDLGIIAELWGDRHIMVTATPIVLQNVPLADVVNIIIEHVRDASVHKHEDFKKQINHKLYAMVACKKAVKAGDSLSRDEMKSLITSFMATSQRLHCPHGRPTSWLISLHDLEKWFQRKK